MVEVVSGHIPPGEAICDGYTIDSGGMTGAGKGARFSIKVA